MQKKSKKLEQKIQEISLMYKQLQKCQFYVVKKNLIGSLRNLCAEGLDILDKQNITPENIRRKKQIQDMQKRCFQIQQKIQAQQRDNPTKSEGIKNPRKVIQRQKNFQNQFQQKEDVKEMDQNQLRQKSRQVAKSMIFHQVTSQNLKITTQQLDQLAARIEKNNNVMKEIEIMVLEQGGDLDKIQHNLQDVYENVHNANDQLDEAADLQKRNRILKIRMGISGFFAAIGLKILGLPGLLFGFLGGMIATK